MCVGLFVCVVVAGCVWWFVMLLLMLVLCWLCMLVCLCVVGGVNGGVVCVCCVCCVCCCCGCVFVGLFVVVDLFAVVVGAGDLFVFVG